MIERALPSRFAPEIHKEVKDSLLILPDTQARLGANAGHNLSARGKTRLWTKFPMELVAQVRRNRLVQQLNLQLEEKGVRLANTRPWQAF